MFDEGGPDKYLGRMEETDTNRGVGQGSGWLGIGVLWDSRGNDTYRTWQNATDDVTHSQGSGFLGGAGILFDGQGEDRYEFSPLEVQGTGGDGKTIEAGGAQAAASAGIGYLIDEGDQRDEYLAGQGLVQGAAAWGGWAYLLDEGGDENTFTLRATTGCPEFDGSALTSSVVDGGCSTEEGPVGGWGQGYADTEGFAGVVTGQGVDHHDHVIVDGSDTSWVGQNILGSGNTTGTALFLDQGGSDIYNATAKAAGHGDRGLGVFLDLGGGATGDTYECKAYTCHGYGNNLTTDLSKISESLEVGAGLGAFYDGSQDNDTFLAGNPGAEDPEDPEDAVWTRNDLGVGVNR